MNSTLTASPSAPKNKPQFFYATAVFLLVVLVFLGFQLFYLHGQAYPGRPLTPPIRPLLIAHGFAMSAWIILLVVQTFLIVSNNVRIHMMLGKFGAVLALCVIYLGFRVAVAAAMVNPPDLKLWGLDPKQFMAISLCGIVLFAGYVAIGIWKRRVANIHRPMMFLGTLAATAAAIDRIGFISHRVAPTVWGHIFGPFFVPVFIAAVFLVTKWALTRSLNRAFAVGFAVLAISGPLIMKLATTEAWDSFANFLMR